MKQLENKGFSVGRAGHDPATYGLKGPLSCDKSTRLTRLFEAAARLGIFRSPPVNQTQPTAGYRRIGRHFWGRLGKTVVGICRQGEADGWVYLIEAIGADRIKIGWTSRSDIGARMRELDAQAPFPLRILAAIRGPRRAEQWLHGRWHRHRIRGEWYQAAGGVSAILEPGLPSVTS